MVRVVTPRPASLLGGFLPQVGGISSQDVGGTFEDENFGVGGVDVTEVARHIETCDIADGTGELDAGSTSADDDELEWRVGSGLLHLALGEFEGEKDTAANLGGVLAALSWGRVWPSRHGRSRSEWSRWRE